MASPQNLIIKLIISAKDEASGVFDSFKAKAASVAAAVSAYFSVNFLAGSVKSAADFEAAMSRVQAATGAAGDELRQLKTAAEDASAKSTFTSVEAAQALENLAKAGLNTKEALAALPGVMALAAAGDISLAESATYVTRTIAGLGIAADDTGRIADVLAKGANASNTSVRGLAEALSYAAPSARSLGLSLEQTVAYIGKFSDAGIDASRAGTALNAILSQFKDPASKFREELTAAGITTSNFDMAIRQLAKSGPEGEKAITAVGLEAGPALRGLLNQGIGALDELKSKLDNAKGSAAETAMTMQGNLNGAMATLSRAWEALTIKLGEPVLPTITQAVKDLTAGLQGAVSSGTVTKWGEALRQAFSSGAEWARKFAGELDPAALTAKLQETAGKIGVWFDDISEKARNAGDILRTAYGVMSAGANTVMTAVYKISEAFAGVSRDMLLGIANIADAFAKMTFGGLSASFKAAAEEIRIAAGGMGAVSEEYARQANKAFGAAVEGAELARKGWVGLTKPTTEAKVAVDAVADGATVAGEKLADLGLKAEASAKQQAKAAESTAVSVKALRGEYDRLVAGGDAQGAVLKLVEINTALRGTKGEASAAAEAIKVATESTSVSVKALRAEYDKLVAGGDAQGAVSKLAEINAALRGSKREASDAADALKAAYQAMGIASKSDLEATAAAFKRHYDAIKTDGTATADMLAQAFKVYAEKAIAANGGVATEALKSEAALRGVRIEADETGKSIVKIGGASDEAGNRIRKNMDDASAAISKVRSDAEKLADRLASIKNTNLGAGGFGNQSNGNGGFDDLRRAGITPEQMKNAGYSAREIEDYIAGNDKVAPGMVNRQVTSSSVNTYQAAINAGLTDAEAKKVGDIYSYYIAKGNLQAQQQAGGTLGPGFNGSDYAAITRDMLNQAFAEAKRLVAEETAAAKKSSSGSSGTQFWGAPNRTVTVNLNIGGKTTSVNAASQADADALVRALQEAAAAQS